MNWQVDDRRLREPAMGKESKATEAQRSFYQSEGYLVIEDFLSPPQLNGLRAACDTLQEEARQSEGDSKHFQLAATLDGAREVVRIADPIGLRDVFRDVATSPDLAELVGSLMGTDSVKIHHTKVVAKPPRSTWGIEWHQDFSYLVHTNYDLLAVSIAVDEVFEENGGIRLIPRSHLKGPLRPPRPSLEANVAAPAWKIDLGEQVAGLQWVAPRIRPGGLCIHHCCLIHGSGPNPTEKWRRVFIIQFAAGNNHQIGGRSDYAGWGEFVLGADPREVRMVSNTFALPPPRSPRNPRGSGSG